VSVGADDARCAARGVQGVGRSVAHAQTSADKQRLAQRRKPVCSPRPHDRLDDGCDTTGVEPGLASSREKARRWRVDEDRSTRTVARAPWPKLGTAGPQVEAIVEHIAEKGHVIDAPGPVEHYEVSTARWGSGSLSWMGNVRMMAAISRSSLCGSALQQDRQPPGVGAVEDARRPTRRLEARALRRSRFYRNNLQVGQPREGATEKKERKGKKKRQDRDKQERKDNGAASADESGCRRFARARPCRYPSRGRGLHGRRGSYPDTAREVFIKMSKQGSTLAGVHGAFSSRSVIGLQYGVPLARSCSKYTTCASTTAGIMNDDPRRSDGRSRSWNYLVSGASRVGYLPDERGPSSASSPRRAGGAVAGSSHQRGGRVRALAQGVADRGAPEPDDAATDTDDRPRYVDGAVEAQTGDAS